MDAIILAGGVGKRAKLNIPKQLMRLGGIPILIRVIKLFSDIDMFKNFIITVPSDIDYYTDLINSYGIKNFQCILGGATRQESVYLALQHINSERVIIHESARPFITKQHILDLISINKPSVVPCISIIPTVFHKDGKFINRDELLNVQLPQVFDTNLLLLAHQKAIGKNYSDDSSLLFCELGIMPTIIDGLEENFKITTPLDCKLAEVLYEEVSSSDRW